MIGLLQLQVNHEINRLFLVKRTSNSKDFNGNVASHAVYAIHVDKIAKPINGTAKLA